MDHRHDTAQTGPGGCARRHAHTHVVLKPTTHALTKPRPKAIKEVQERRRLFIKPLMWDKQRNARKEK